MAVLKPQASPRRCKTGSMRKTPNVLNTKEQGKERREGKLGKEVGRRQGGE